MPQRERRTLPCGDHKIVVPGEYDAERERTLQMLERGTHGIDRAETILHFVRDQMHDGFSVGFRLELMTFRFKFGAQFAEVLDDAVMDDGDFRRHVRMRIAFGRTAVRGPARVPDTGQAGERLGQQARFQIAQFAFGAAARQRAGFDGRDASRIITAVFETPERVDQIGRDRRFTEDSDDPAHAF